MEPLEDGDEQLVAPAQPRGPREALEVVELERRLGAGLAQGVTRRLPLLSRAWRSPTSYLTSKANASSGLRGLHVVSVQTANLRLPLKLFLPAVVGLTLIAHLASFSP